MPRSLKLLALVLMLLPGVSAMAQNGALDAAQEARAQTLFYELRCMVCEGQSVAESPAEVARDIRSTVRERIAQGQNDETIKEYLVSRYGQNILLTPPLMPKTYLLWFGPLVVLFLGAAIIFAYIGAGRVEKK